MRVLVVVATCWGARVDAQTSDRLLEGQRAFTEADFTRSAQILEELLETEPMSSADLVRALTHLSAVAWIEGDPDRAEQRAREALAIDPSAEAPPGAPQELSARMRALADEVTPLGIEMNTLPAVRGPGTLRARVRGETTLPATLFLRCGEESAEGEREVTVTLLPAIERCDAELRLETGTILARESALLRSVASAADAAASVRSEEPTAPLADTVTRRRRWIGSLAGAVALVGTIVAIALLAGGDDPPQLTGVRVLP